MDAVYERMWTQVCETWGGDKVLENPTRACMMASQVLMMLLRDVANLTTNTALNNCLSSTLSKFNDLIFFLIILYDFHNKDIVLFAF